MDDLVFQIANTYALICWVFLWFFPTKNFTQQWIRSGMAPFALALIYTALVFSLFYSSASSGENPDWTTLGGLSSLFSGERALLTGWIHYLCFDMLVGIWIVGNAEKNNIKHLYIIPTLFFTCMLGPIGFLLYFIFRNYYKKQMMGGLN
jgi:hypothetical protein